MIMNLLFALIPAFIAGMFFHGLVYWGCTVFIKKYLDEKDRPLEKKRAIFTLQYSFFLYMAISTYNVWNTYGYRVEAQPFGQHQMQYEPQKTEVQTGKKLVETEDRRGDFHEKAFRKPE